MVYVEDDSTMYVPNRDALEGEAGALDHLTGKAAILSHPGQIRICGHSIYSWTSCCLRKTTSPCRAETTF